MRRAAICAALVSFALAQPAASHDFWVQPEAFSIEPGVDVAMTLQVGHGPDRQRSAIPAGRIKRFVAVSPDGAAIDMRPSLSLGEPEADGVLRFQAPGVHVVALETDSRAQTQLSASRFNLHVAEEGLSPALEQRVAANRMTVGASERYSRVAKSILAVGAAGPEGGIGQAIGLPLEIILDANPYALPRPATLPVRVLYEGEPLVGALVKLTDLDHDATPFATLRTGETGRAEFPMPSAGRWRLNVVWTKPLPPTEDADFETVFSSLTFGLPTAGGAGTPRVADHRPSGTPR